MNKGMIATLLWGLLSVSATSCDTAAASESADYAAQAYLKLEPMLRPSLEEAMIQGFTRGLEAKIGKERQDACPEASATARRLAASELMPAYMKLFFSEETRALMIPELASIYSLEQLRKLAAGDNPPTTKAQSAALAAAFRKLYVDMQRRAALDPELKAAMTRMMTESMAELGKCMGASSRSADAVPADL